MEATPAVPLDDQRALGVVLVIDASTSMAKNALIERVKEAAHEFVNAKAATDQIAVVSFAEKVTVVQEFTTDKDELNKAIDDIALELETSVYDAIVRSAALYRDSDLQPNLIVFSDGQDSTLEGHPGRRPRRPSPPSAAPCSRWVWRTQGSIPSRRSPRRRVAQPPPPMIRRE